MSCLLIKDVLSRSRSNEPDEDSGAQLCKPLLEVAGHAACYSFNSWKEGPPIRG